MRAPTTDLTIFFGNGDFHAALGRLHRGTLATGTRTEHKQVVVKDPIAHNVASIAFSYLEKGLADFHSPASTQVFAMLLACVQTDVAFANISANVERTIDWLEKCADRGAELVVMPECMLSGYAYDSRESAMANAKSINDPLFAELAQVAERCKLHFSLGFLEQQGERLFNASVLIGASGIVGHYRKVHLPHLGVDRFVDRGNFPYKTHTATTSTAGDVNIGLAICYDCSFPEPMRLLGLGGADIIALGTNWPVAACRTAELVPPARSMENHLFFAAANRVGEENSFKFCGLSSICGPDGVVFASSSDDQETLLVAEIDPMAARNKKIERTPGTHVIDRFADRRPEFYGGLDKAVQEDR